jgi:uncharacterized protein (UPF0218 family)
MPRYIYSSELGKLIPAEEYYFDKYLQQADKQMTVGNRPVSLNFIKDEMEPTRHMCNGKIYTSKKKFRDETKARNCIEVGNEATIKPRQPIKLDRRQRRDDIRKAIHDLKNGKAKSFMN